MKIVCMDCQTESYVDVELFKDTKRIECNHCAENLPVTSLNEVRDEPSHSVHENSGAFTEFSQETTAESIFSELEEGNILDISDIPSRQETSDLLEIDEVISLPLYETSANFSEETTSLPEAYDTPQVLKIAQPVLPEQFPSALSPAVESPKPIEESSNSAQSIEVPSLDVAETPQNMKVLTVATPILLVFVAAFVVFITLGNMITAPRSEVRAESAPPAQTSTLPAKQVKPEVAAVPARPVETVKPTPLPTPVVTETKPAPEPVPTTQQEVPASGTEKGQFTVQVGSHNDQGAANAQAEKLKAAGFEARVVSVDIPKRGRWFRVQTGNFNSRDEANRFGAQILAKGAAETFVISGL